VRTTRRAIGALIVLSLALVGPPVGADGSYPTFENGVLVPTGGIPYDRDAPAVNASSTPLRGGTFVRPVAGSSSYTDTFGACRGSGCSRPHLGVDLLGTKGTPVVAVDAGRIVWVSSTCCALAIRHDDGWTSYYIHLNNDTPGTDDGLGQGIVAGLGNGSRVSAGQHIGWRGDSGNAENSGAHLHFELQDPSGVWHDPTPYVDSGSTPPGGLPGPPGAPATTTTEAPPTTTSTAAPTTTVAPPTTTTTSPTTTSAPPTTTVPVTAAPATGGPAPTSEASTTTEAPVSTVVLEISDGTLAVLTGDDLEGDLPGRVDVAGFGYVAPASTDGTVPDTTPPSTAPEPSPTTTGTLVSSVEETSAPEGHATLGSVEPEPWRTVVFRAAAEVGAWLAGLGA
jgi:hypothetical protein